MWRIHKVKAGTRSRASEVFVVERLYRRPGEPLLVAVPLRAFE